MAAPRRTGRSRLTLGLLILTSLAVLTLDFRDAGPVRGARELAATIFSPLRGVADTMSTPFSNVWNGITDYGDVKNENERLREENDELRGRAVLGQDAIDQLGPLLEQLEIPWIDQIETRVARVTAGPVSNFSFTIEIDKGSDDGIAYGMPVVTGAGLVGRVVQAAPGTSTVQLLTDPDFRVGVRVIPGGTPGTARGGGRGERLEIDTALEPGAELSDDAVLTTSGADRSAFPASIPVAEVTGSRAASGGLTLDLLAEPFADTSGLSYVTVLLHEEEP
ncbi:MAG: rod shape-determining protein MreC [Actinomycetota bacterium]|nr:rod shape-determining protein MreC [Actinomycetota bacterium]